MPLQEEFETQGNYLFRYRGVLPILILIAGILVFVIYHPSPVPPLTWQYEILCLGVSLVGLAIRVMTIAFRFQGTSGRNTRRQVAENLNTTGIYSVVRHPLYLGNFFMSLGIGMLVHSLWFLIVFIGVYWLYYERIMYAEEQFLRKKFGEKYLQWASKTPSFIPTFRNWKKPETQINWWHAVRNEINCILSLCSVFLIFEIVERVFKGNFLGVLISDWELYATMIALLVYTALKGASKIKRYSPVL